MASSKLAEARHDRVLQMVETNDMRYIQFGSDGVQCLGTQHLNSCTAVAIVSSEAAILAHIPPRPSASDPDRATGDKHAEAQAKAISVLFRLHQQDFQHGSGGVVVYAVADRQIALEDQKRIIENQITGCGIPFTSVAYDVLKLSEERSVGKGEVLIDARQGKPIVWVEDSFTACVEAGTFLPAGMSAADSSES
ncbi:MAG: hypothetical protein Q9163_002716 [Psora crenata]